MKKSIITLINCAALFLFLSPSLFAQQTTITTSNDEIIIIQKATDTNGDVKVDTKTLEKGEKFKVYLEDLDLENMDGQDVKIEVFNTTIESDLIQIEGGEEETIFMFKPAKKNDADPQEVEKLIITLNEPFAEHPVEPKPLLGVYSENANKGARITGIVSESGAQKAGIQKGDIITSLNGIAVTTTSGLTAAITQHKVGESVTVDYLRNGQAAQTTATLGTKKERRTYANLRHRNYQYQMFQEDDNHNNHSFQDRDPCKVFIGVFTSSIRTGLKVHSIIDNTPAKKSAVQKGDIILAIDDVEVNTHQGLITQRDAHQPGDFFTLSILRKGQPMEIDAQFEACPTKETISEEALTLEETVIPEFEITQNTLDLENFSVFPNPTYGPVTLKFKGEAVPTTIRMTDVTGKVVYEEVLNSFDGFYDKTINYQNATPGTLILTVQQDQKIYSEAVMLMRGA